MWKTVPTMTHYKYSAYGLLFQSDRPLPLLMPATDEQTGIEPQITIETTSETIDIPEPSFTTYTTTFSHDIVRYRLAGIATYWSRRGQAIYVLPETDDDVAITLFLLDMPLIALLYQRNLFVLRAGAILFDGLATLIVGASGVGKTVALEMLRERGYPVICDNFAVITYREDGAYVQPGYPEIHLTRRALHLLSSWDKEPEAVRPGAFKYRLPLADDFHPHATRIDRLYVLKGHNENDIVMQQVDGMIKFWGPTAHIPYKRLELELMDHIERFKVLSKMGQTARIAHIEMSKAMKLSTKLVDAIIMDRHE